MAADTDHALIVDNLARNHEARLLRSLEQLENQITTIVSGSPTQKGDQLFDLTYALSSRTAIQNAITGTYLTEADAIIREYDQVVQSLETMFEKYGAFARVPDSVITQLQNVSFQGFEDVAARFTDELANTLYQNTLVGGSRTDSIRSLRQSINGVYIQADEPEIRRLVAVAKAGGPDAEDAVRQLHQIYAADRAGNNMRRYASQMVNDSIRQFDSQIAVSAGNEIGAEKWKYYGSLIEDSRDHCVKYRNKVLTTEQIREIWSTKNWAGKAQGDPFVVRGGYNCRHRWRPYFDEDDDTPDTSVQEQVKLPKQKLDFSDVKAKKRSPRGLVDDDINTWVKLVESDGGIRDEATFVMNRYQPSFIVSKKTRGAFYQPEDRHIENDPKNKHVFLHEYGHSIDYDLGANGRPISEIKLADAAKKDAELLGLSPYRSVKASDPNSDQYIPYGEYQETFNQNILKIREDISEKTPVYFKRGPRKGLLKGYNYQTDDTNTAISDIVDSMTDGWAHSYHYMAGHGTRYYARGEDWKQTENFANLFANYAKGGEHWEKTVEKFPNLTKAFEEIIGDVIDGRTN